MVAAELEIHISQHVGMTATCQDNILHEGNVRSLLDDSNGQDVFLSVLGKSVELIWITYVVGGSVKSEMAAT